MLAFPLAAIGSSEQLVIKVSANGTRNLQPFTVQDRWELRWNVKGESFSVMLFSAEGEPRGLLPIASQDGPGQGSTYYPKGGSYYLKILAKDDWTISVVQLP